MELVNAASKVYKEFHGLQPPRIKGTALRKGKASQNACKCVCVKVCCVYAPVYKFVPTHDERRGWHTAR